MSFVKPESNRFAQIKVLGIGGAGGNCVNTMVQENQIRGIDFVAINTDAQALLSNQASIKIQIGEKLTKGLGAGGDPEIGKKAAEESKEKIKKLIANSDMIFITGGEGGGTCTGAAPVIAQIAKEMNILTVAVVTKPFHFEGYRRMASAKTGIAKLKEKVDTLIIVPNQKLLSTVDPKMSLIQAFKMVDSVLISGVKGIADLITQPGLINLDFADVKSIIQSAGSALMGIGTAKGENRGVEAAKKATASPLLETSIEGAQGILFNISGDKNMTMKEIEEASEIIFSQADPNANIIFGATINEEANNELSITIIATGFNQNKNRLARLAKREQPSGIISELPIEKKPFDEKDKVLFENEKIDMEKDRGEEFETPAFLRQGKKKLIN